MGLLIAGYIWRSHRVVRLETESVTGRLRNVPRDWAMSRSWQGLGVPEKVTPEVIEEMDRLVAARLLPNDETLAKVMRYGTGLHRQLMDTIQQLIVIRALRPAWEGKTLEAPTPAVEVRRAGKRVVIRVKGAGSDRQGRSRGAEGAGFYEQGTGARELEGDEPGDLKRWVYEALSLAPDDPSRLIRSRRCWS
ncbi:MAG TPA: hypothetical protein VMR52_12875 [Dehalococcoidia bacterium]|nr:hypothetical protein [Dehalococcoidia bacterium]